MILSYVYCRKLPLVNENLHCGTTRYFKYYDVTTLHSREIIIRYNRNKPQRRCVQVENRITTDTAEIHVMFLCEIKQRGYVLYENCLISCKMFNAVFRDRSVTCVNRWPNNCIGVHKNALYFV